MKKPYLTAGFTQRLRQLGLTALLAGGATVAAHAQTLNYAVAGATNVVTTYTDLGTTGTAITTANTDDANSAVQNIGFTFNYNGTAYTQFTLNTNGFIKLGATAPSDTKLFLSETVATQLDVFQSPTDPNIIAPFNTDLTAGTSAPEYRVTTTGTSPNQVCTIQWKNVSDKAATNPTQYANLSFQVRLFETTGVVELVYGSATAGTTSALRFTQVGLKGASFGAGQIVQATKQSASAWSTVVFADYTPVAANMTLNTLNIRTVALPDAGRTFRFTPNPPNDAAVAGVYTYGKLATSSTLPHAVRAVITNTGSTVQSNLVATLNVTGANTFTDTKTITTLAAGASSIVTFANYPATLTAGSNVVTVTIPADGNSTNNSSVYNQTITADRISYTDPVKAASGLVGLPGAIFTSKYTLPAATTVTDVVVTFGASTGNTAPYQVLLYDATGTGGLPGQVIYTSPTQNRTAAAGPATITLPGVAVPATFYVALKDNSSATGTTNLGVSYQIEDPIRPSTFYFTQDNGATWIDFVNATPKARFAIEIGTSTPACAAPTAVTVGNTTATGATVTFTPPVSGTSSYQVVYGPTGFNPATGGTTVTSSTSPVTLTGLTAGTTYQVYVRSNCTAGGTSASTTAVSFSTACGTVAPITVFPYTESFDTVLSGQTVPCGITVLDANADGATWRSFPENPFSGTNAMRYQGSILNNVVANDWFFTPALVLPGTANTRYQVAFRYRASGTGTTGTSNFTESLEVKSGTAATAAGQTNLLYTNNSINNIAYALAGGASTPVVAYLPAGASTQYVGFHIISAINQGNLYIDDLSVTAVTVTGTSEALLRAVNVFPNPSASGVFNLAINGANAKQALEVEVTNNLGQRVYVGSARDNFTSQIDLSRLATGLYHLKVKNGDEYMLRQISIVK